MYFLIYKPFGMLSQFSVEAGQGADKSTLADLPFRFEKDVYPVGRLDADSEGLLLLTCDKQVNNRLLNPRFLHNRTYWVQVEGEPTEADLGPLIDGMTISIDGKPYQTLPAKAELLPEPALPPRNPPIRFRANVPTSWIALTLHEGKNRQVRRMTAAIGFPTLRLVRWAIENLTADSMRPGDVQELTETELKTGLRLGQ
jgi:23S rRNA pseudouridine2457 synthase